MKRKTILTMLIVVVVLVISGCLNTDADTKSQNQKDEERIINTNMVTEVTEENTLEDEKQATVPLELTAQNPDIKLNIGEQNKLFYTANRDVVVTYTSSDEAVATVDDSGVVTAVGNGTTTITASCEGESCEWTVTSIPDWGKLYADYFLMNSEFRERFCNDCQETICEVFYINNDYIPEVVVGDPYDFMWSIYSIIDQEVKCVWDDSLENTYWGYGTSYRGIECIERTGIFFGTGWPGSVHSAYTHFYILNNDGSVSKELANKLDENYFWETGEDKETYYYKEDEISEEEFNKRLNELSNGQWIGEEEYYSNADYSIEIPIEDFIATYQ